ncbi:hypothetical protein HYC85_006412 [Camellia sinensis]|uniref:PAP/OAS1 substrate-binding-related domain-containing protein n=1 Tax=Camellia sinensis TaxID=4442 RepID=A0A7J7HNJ6_CAMSI|nr:hypothetical protein HYC85_006412 [Camellia sinensis]
MGDLREEERQVPSPPSPSSSNPERWNRAEEATQKIVWQVQPTVLSEKRRREVIDYVERLIGGAIGCELVFGEGHCKVFPFGSVPLKTYLPDGDIDLTAFGGANVEDALVNEVVKLVKCIIQNIVVDISFNQLGGLCTLCFLEQVDHLIGKDHLFKRIVSWCSSWLDFYICFGDTGSIHLPFFPFSIEWSFSSEFSSEKPENGTEQVLSSSRGFDINSRTFCQKHLNIIDPLKENNNLGRSVSKGNYYRIRSAFSYGARKLGRILLQPEENIAGELCKFFSNTLDIHGSAQRPDVQDPVPMSGHNSFISASSILETVSGQKESAISDLNSANGSSHNGDYNSELSRIKTKVGRTVNGYQNGYTKVVNAALLSETDGSPNRTVVMGSRFSGDAEDLATSRIQSLKISNDTTKAFHPSGEENPDKNLPVGNHEVPTTVGSKDVASDLSGDYKSHLHSLEYGWWCYEHSSSVPALPMIPMLPSQFHSKSSWDVIRHAYHFKRNGFSNVNANGVIPRPTFYHMNTLLLPGITFGAEEMPKPRGTGTYFPNVNRPPYQNTSTGRGRNQGPVRSPRNNGQAVTPMETNLLDRSSRELSQTQFSDQGYGKSGSSDSYECGSPGGTVYPDINSLLLQSDGVIEFGSAGHVPLAVTLPECSRQLNPASLLPQTST